MNKPSLSPKFSSAIIVASLTAIALAGCSSQEKKRPALTETFNTEITENNSKLFVYTISPERSNERRPPSGQGGGRDSKGGGKPSENKSANRETKIASKANEMLQATLDENQYCQDGYMELESFFNRGRYTIRGECRDSATDSDRENYTN